jgi:CubicO group peptidase (beta-lactamase class C family)
VTDPRWPIEALGQVVLLSAVGCGAGGAATATASGAPPAGAAGRVAEVREFLSRAADETGFNGVVLIGLRGDPVLEEAYGWADVEMRVALRPDHRFRIGSLTKPVTAAAALMAIDRGLLAKDTSVCSHLAPCPTTWRAVTVHHLLTHTSGIPDHFGDLEAVPVEETIEELQRVVRDLPADEPLVASPGAEYAYSNFNYVLLGALLEAATGSPWATVLDQWIFEPLGLRSMRYDDVYAIVPDRVRGYARDDSLGLRNIDYDDHGAYAAGGLLANARDLYAFVLAAIGGDLFAPSLVAEALQPDVGDYGYGWQIREFFGRPVYNHTGGIDGFSSHVAVYPSDSLVIVVLSNVGIDPAILRACDVAAGLFDWPVRHVVGQQPPEPRLRCGVER